MRRDRETSAPSISMWSPTDHYIGGDIVYHEGAFYKLVGDIEDREKIPAKGAYWQRLVINGVSENSIRETLSTVFVHMDITEVGSYHLREFQSTPGLFVFNAKDSTMEGFKFNKGILVSYNNYVHFNGDTYSCHQGPVGQVQFHDLNKEVGGKSFLTQFRNQYSGEAVLKEEVKQAALSKIKMSPVKAESISGTDITFDRQLGPTERITVVITYKKDSVANSKVLSVGQQYNDPMVDRVEVNGGETVIHLSGIGIEILGAIKFDSYAFD